MKKSFLRAAVVACLPLCLMAGAFVTTPAVAADKSASSGPKISKAIGKEITDAQKALSTKDYATAIAKCKEALAKPDLTDFDKYVANRLLAASYVGLNDHVSARAPMIAAVQSPAIPDGDLKTLVAPAIELENEAKDYAMVIQLGQMAITKNLADDIVYGEMALAYYEMKDYPNAAVNAKKSIDTAKSLSKIPTYAAYQVLAMSLEQTKNTAGEIATLEEMVVAYGKPEDWGFLIGFAIDDMMRSKGSSREIATLDVYRLAMTIDVLKASQDFMAMADDAEHVRSPGDAKTALQAGLAKGVLTQAKAGPLLNKANADAKTDQAILEQAEATAAKSPLGKSDLAVGEAYFGYGRYADAARVAQRAIGKGGATLAEAKVLLGMSQVKQQDYAGAIKTLSDVQGDTGLVKAAHLWSIYATQLSKPSVEFTVH